MFSYKTLDTTNIEILHKVFVDAFSDYQVKMDLPSWKFEQMLQRRDYVAEMSIGEFENERLVGFILNRFRIWNETFEVTVYWDLLNSN